MSQVQLLLQLFQLNKQYPIPSIDATKSHRISPSSPEHSPNLINFIIKALRIPSYQSGNRIFKSKHREPIERESQLSSEYQTSS